MSVLSAADEFGQNCDVDVSRYPMDGSTRETWHAIWAAGIDIFTTCVTYGMGGPVDKLGMYHYFLRMIASTSIWSLRMVSVPTSSATT